MIHPDHVDLLRPAAQAGGVWADLGSGTGAFTLALTELLGAQGGIISVDQDAGALSHQQRELRARFPHANVRMVTADFRHPIESMPRLDGLVMANALHFHRDKQRIVEHVCGWLKPGGAFVLIEYNVDTGNHWVPHPLSCASWEALAARSGLINTRKIAGKPSRFLNEIYAALSQKRSDSISS